MSTKLADSRVEEFKQLVATTVEWKLMEMLGDPDEGLELREEIKARLRRPLEAERRGARGVPAQEVAAQLGLE